jgi:hypothetical protein
MSKKLLPEQAVPAYDRQMVMAISCNAWQTTFGQNSKYIFKQRGWQSNSNTKMARYTHGVQHAALCLQESTAQHF